MVKNHYAIALGQIRYARLEDGEPIDTQEFPTPTFYANRTDDPQVTFSFDTLSAEEFEYVGTMIAPAFLPSFDPPDLKAVLTFQYQGKPVELECILNGKAAQDDPVRELNRAFAEAFKAWNEKRQDGETNE